MSNLLYISSFRLRLLLLLASLLGLTLGVQYYVNLRSVRINTELLAEQEQTIMAGVALGVNNISSNIYLEEMAKTLKQPLLNPNSSRTKNVLVIDGEGDVRDSLDDRYAPKLNEDGSTRYVPLSQVQLPPISPVVEFVDESKTRPLWLKVSAPAKPGEPGAFYLPVETNQGRWYVIVVLGSASNLTNILQEQASKSLRYTLLLLLVTTLVTGILVWRFTRPIKDLSIAARRVAGGDFSIRVQAQRHDEVGLLTEAFNEMTSQLGRTRQLESQLHQAEKGAVVGRLASAIAHEIRNPLNYINLTLDHLRSTFAPAEPEKRKTFDRLASQLKAEVARINTHITDFLSYSRPSRLEPQPVDLRAAAADALQMIEAQAAEHGIETRIEQNGEVPEVAADRQAIRSVLTNLLINSLQAMDGEGGSIVVNIAKDETGQRAQIEVTDTGRGIAPDDISKVFEPYYSTKETGTGLGLAIVKKAIDEHGGTIGVTSRQGSGTTFTITLPITAIQERMRDEG
ncbi:MAG TPA: ATP-binding protein [Pyrinomonadaceae bacterium]|nr:ATP-binding protein [Pyrinomonadaceae bacterium]